MRLGVFCPCLMPLPRRELLGVVQEFEVLKEVGVCQVPLIFLLVQGSAAPRDDLAELDRLGSASVEMARTILSMPQPIYGLALGETLGISTRGWNWKLQLVARCLSISLVVLSSSVLHINKNSSIYTGFCHCVQSTSHNSGFHPREP